MQKRYRLDLNFWEEEKTFMFITYYVYSIRKQGVAIKYKRLFKHPDPIYHSGATFTKVYFDKEYFKKEFEGNKMLIPSGWVLK